MKKFTLDKVPLDAHLRWDLDISRTIKRGYSLDHATGKREPGISVLTPDLFFGDEMENRVAHCITNYSDVVVIGTTLYVIKGTVNGSDSEGFHTLEADSIKILGEIPREERIRAHWISADDLSISFKGNE